METFAISAIRWIPCFSLLIYRTPPLDAQRVLVLRLALPRKIHLDYWTNGRLVSAEPGTHSKLPPLKANSGYRRHGPRTL